MLTESEETRRLHLGPAPGEEPGAVGLIEINVEATDDVSGVMSRCKDVLLIVSQASESEFRSHETLAQLLPAWFVEGCAPEESTSARAEWLAWWRGLDGEERARVAEERAWGLEDWLYWMQPEERQWLWWDLRSVGETQATLLLEVKAWPIAMGALMWLLRLAGATDATVARTQ